MPPVYFARNYRGLRDVRWSIPDGLSALVGPNGAGKSTLLFLPEVLKLATTATGALSAAIDASGGIRALRHLGAAVGAPVQIGVAVGGDEWTIEPAPNGSGIAAYPGERLVVDGNPVFSRQAGSLTYPWQGKEVTADSRTVLRRLYDADLDATFAGRPLCDALSHYAAYFDHDLPRLRTGSDKTASRTLDAHGRSAFAVLRNWRDWDADRHRWQFVIDSLRECFGFFADLNFQEGGNVVEGHVVQSGFGRQAIPAAQASNGFLAALVHFTAVASAERGGVVAIDEFENSLHPRAIASSLTSIEAFALQHGISVVIATQSPLVLDAFDARPEAVLVMRGTASRQPEPLSSLRTSEWLSHFRLGDKFAEGDFGAEPTDTETPG